MPELADEQPESGWFADLYRAHYRRLVLVAYALTGNLGEAEEAVQDAFERCYPRRARLQHMAEPAGYLATAAINEVRRRHRRRSVLNRLLGRGPGIAAQVDPSFGPESIDLHRALATLPAPWREALVLHHLADLPVGEVAERLKVPVGTVKSRLSRGREALAELLEPPEPAADPRTAAGPAPARERRGARDGRN